MMMSHKRRWAGLFRYRLRARIYRVIEVRRHGAKEPHKVFIIGRRRP